MRWKHSFLCAAFEPTAFRFDQFMNFCGKRFHKWNNIFSHFHDPPGAGVPPQIAKIYIVPLHTGTHTDTQTQQPHVSIRLSSGWGPSCIGCTPNPFRGESFEKPKIYLIVIPWFSLKYFAVFRILDLALPSMHSLGQQHTDNSTKLERTKPETDSLTLFLRGASSQRPVCCGHWRIFDGSHSNLWVNCANWCGVRVNRSGYTTDGISSVFYFCYTMECISHANPTAHTRRQAGSERRIGKECYLFVCFATRRTAATD